MSCKQSRSSRAVISHFPYAWSEKFCRHTPPGYNLACVIDTGVDDVYLVKSRHNLNKSQQICANLREWSTPSTTIDMLFKQLCVRMSQRTGYMKSWHIAILQLSRGKYERKMQFRFTITLKIRICNQSRGSKSYRGLLWNIFCVYMKKILKKLQKKNYKNRIPPPPPTQYNCYQWQRLIRAN